MSKIQLNQFESRDSVSSLNDIDFSEFVISNPYGKKSSTRLVQAKLLKESDHALILLDKTNRDLTRLRVQLEPGCIISNGVDRYICEEVKYLYPAPHMVLIKATEAA